MKQISEKKQKRILTLRKKGLSIKKIASKLDIRPNTVLRYVNPLVAEHERAYQREQKRKIYAIYKKFKDKA